MTRSRATRWLVRAVPALFIGIAAAVRVLPYPWDLIYVAAVQVAGIATLVMLVRSWSGRS